jgi:microcystin-dependent protein
VGVVQRTDSVDCAEPALFSILRTPYGGNAQTTFALPNLQGRVPIHPGQGPGLSPHDLGQVEGVENEKLLITQMPAHNHAATVTIDASAFSLSASEDPTNAVAAGACSARAARSRPSTGRPAFCGTR